MAIVLLLALAAGAGSGSSSTSSSSSSSSSAVAVVLVLVEVEVEEGPIEIRTLSLPAGRDKNCSPVCCFDPPLLQRPPTLHHISTPGLGICEIQKGFSWVLKGLVRKFEGFALDIERFENKLMRD